MKKGWIVFAMVFVLGIGLTSGWAAARGMMWRGSGGWGMGAPYNRLYDPKTLEPISGDIVRVDRITPMKGMSHGIHLAIKTDQGEISVHLGPAWFVENQDITIEPGDKVEVKGSRVTIQGKPAIIAASLRKGDETLELRDENGVPVWSGMRRR